MLPFRCIAKQSLVCEANKLKEYIIFSIFPLHSKETLLCRMYYAEAISLVAVDLYSFVKKYISWIILQINFYILWRLFTARFYINDSLYETSLCTYEQRLFAKTLIENEGIVSLDDFMEDDLYITIDGAKYFIMYSCVPQEDESQNDDSQNMEQDVSENITPKVSVMLLTPEGFKDIEIKCGDYYYFGMVNMQI